MNQIKTLLGDITPQQFLEEYWQKKPLLIRGALTGYESPITPEELAGLACEEEVESRLVMEKGGDHPWQLKSGPFSEDEFLTLPDSHWTLLVQEANKHIPQLTPLLEQFNFIPSWWLDDIMISYAPDQGTVGPHYDYYDVFLLQVEGKKRWQINTQPVDKDNIIPDIKLRIMQMFETEYEWVLEPGDMLYLPPGVAHHGVAEGDSLTFSIGYRALSQKELVDSFMDHLLQQLPSDKHLTDERLTLQQHPGEITKATLKQVAEMIRSIPLDDQLISDWFGQYITEPKTEIPAIGPETPLSEQQCLKLLQQHNEVYRSEYSRLNFIRNSDGTIDLFMDGGFCPLSANQTALAELFCDQPVINAKQLLPLLRNENSLAVFQAMINHGVLYFPAEDDE